MRPHAIVHASCKHAVAEFDESAADLAERKARTRRITSTCVHLLNADSERAVQESMLVAQAGMSSHITVATNMAGRGTDILLGGDADQLLLLSLAQPYNQGMLDKCDAYRKESDTVAPGSKLSPAAAEVQVRWPKLRVRCSCGRRGVCADVRVAVLVAARGATSRPLAFHAWSRDRGWEDPTHTACRCDQGELRSIACARAATCRELASQSNVQVTHTAQSPRGLEDP